MKPSTTSNNQSQTVRMLLELSFPPHRIGYGHLCIAIPQFAKDKRQCLTSDLYPYIAEQLSYPDWTAVERAIRDIIAYAWKHRNPVVWEKYFPGCKAAPSNKRFIATLAEYLDQ